MESPSLLKRREPAPAPSVGGVGAFWDLFSIFQLGTAGRSPGPGAGLAGLTYSLSITQPTARAHQGGTLGSQDIPHLHGLWWALLLFLHNYYMLGIESSN